MKLQLKKAETSVILVVFIQDSSSSTGAGLSGLDQTSSIVGGYVKRGGTGVALAVDENVTTEGTYEAPSTAGQVRIGTPANMRAGTYELHFHNDLFTTADYVVITLGGASNMADLPIEIQLTDIDLNTASTPQTGDVYDLLTNDGTLAIDSLTIDSGTGDALTISGGGAAGHGIIITGSGTGAGVLSTGGPAAAGIVATGGGSSQNGFEGNGNATAGSGMLLTGGDAGLELTGTGTGMGLKATGGAGGGAGMSITGMGAGDGIEIIAGASASGIKATAGDNAGHAGVKILGPATATGFALDLRGRGSGSHGIRALAGTDGDGIKATLDGSGADIRGDITGTIDTCTTNSDMRGTDLAFTADSGRAVAGQLTALNDFDPDNDNVAVVTLVTTTTTNSDMRGTDLAFTAASGRAAVSTIDSISVDTGTTIPATLTQMQGAGFDSATDSLKSIRDRGDAAWTTGGGGSTSASVISDRVWDETVRTLTANTNLENLEVDITKIAGSALSETSDGNIAGNLSTFYDNADATTIKTVDDVGGGAASVPPSIR